MVDATEVGNDDGHRQGDDEHATERTDRAEDFSGNCLWYHVAVPANDRLESV